MDAREVPCNQRAGTPAGLCPKLLSWLQLVAGGGGPNWVEGLLGTLVPWCGRAIKQNNYPFRPLGVKMMDCDFTLHQLHAREVLHFTQRLE